MNEVLTWMRESALPLATVQAGNGFADLERLRTTIGDARIVSLGEATHGTREFFQLKHRLLEFCVSRLGFTMFGIEASFPECLRVNDYVLRGEGDPAEALTGMRFWTWDTQEVLDLVKWMRGWNLSHARKVKFYGFDMQSPTEAALGVIDYLKRVAPGLAASSTAALWPLSNDFSADQFALGDGSTREAALACVQRVLEAFARERVRWIEATSTLEWQLARLHAVVLDQGARMHLGTVERDVAMARNVAALLEIEGPEAKAVLWAHNGHVARDSPYFTEEKKPAANMGSTLNEMFGRKHLVVGFSFNQGTFQARSVRGELINHSVAAAPEGSLDNMLAATGMSQFLLDLATAPAAGPVADWLAAKPATRWIGAVYSAERAASYEYASDPRRSYDVLAFVESTSAARPNAITRPLQPPNREPAQAPANLNFGGSGEVPEGWSAPGLSRRHAHAVTLASEASPSGGRTICIARSSAPWRWGNGELNQTFSAQAWRGKRLRLSAAMRANVSEAGAAAQLYIQLLPKPPDGALWVAAKRVAMLAQPVRSSQWATRAVEIDVPEDVHAVVVGVVLTGNGACWFGDVSVQSG